MIIAEVPDFDAFQSKLRFDAITHQHFHYFDGSSLETLAHNAGMRVVALKRNPNGSNGGSILVALEQDLSAQVRRHPPKEELVRRKRDLTRSRSERFTELMGIWIETTTSFEGRKWVFGSSLTLSSLNYFLNNALATFDGILDENPSAIGREYKNLPLTVKPLPSASALQESLVLCGSIENARPITRRIIDLRPRIAIIPPTQ